MRHDLVSDWLQKRKKKKASDGTMLSQLFSFESHVINCGYCNLRCLETVCLPQDVFSLLESISSGCNVLSLAVLEGDVCVRKCVCLLMNAYDSVSRSVRNMREVLHGPGVCGYRATLIW